MAKASSGAGAGASELYVPYDMTFEILTRLPANCLLDLKLVSRMWRSLISSRHFISTHRNRAPAALLICARKLYVPLADRVSSSNGHAIFVHRPGKDQLAESETERFLKFPGSDAVVYNPMAVVGAAPNGIVCISQNPFADNFTLWNPSTRKAMKIPGPDLPSMVSYSSTGFAYDLLHEKYAIIHMVRVGQYSVSSLCIAQVFNFQTGLWVQLGPVNFHTYTSECEAIVNGIPYWRAKQEGSLGPKLLWFDMHSSMFMIQEFVWPMMGREMCLGEIREGCVGAIVWGIVEDFQNINIWTRSEEGFWSHTYWFNNNISEMGETFVGFHIDGMIVDQFEYTIPEYKGICFLIKTSVNFTQWIPFCRLDGAWTGKCKLLRYKESLTDLPKIQNNA